MFYFSVNANKTSFVKIQQRNHPAKFSSAWSIGSVVIHGSVDSSLKGWVMVFNATFSNISVISWSSVLLVNEANDSNK
jgi:hypothetical protein